MSTHPGGEDLISKEIGKNIDEPFEEAEHTKSARNIFKDLEIVGVMQSSDQTSTDDDKDKVKNATGLEGEELASEFQFDYTRGLWWQLWNTEWTFEEYYTYINEPKHLVNPVRNLRLFDNDICETLTMTPWWGILVCYAPLIFSYFWCQEGTRKENICMFTLGFFFWTVLEYVLHRFLFHMEDQFYFVKHSKFQAIHFLVHGIHHAFPCDAYRLVFPPILGLPLWMSIVAILKTLLPSRVLNSVLFGISCGYWIYDLTHYYFHHSNPAEGSWAKNMKVYHMQHHYKNGTVGFGVTNKFWDRVFDTELTKKQIDIKKI